MKLAVNVCAGGMAARHGVGSAMRNYLDEWQRGPDAPPVRVLDSCGDFSRARMPMRFASAFFRTLFLLATNRVALLHIHVAAFGSALRKGSIAALGYLFGKPVILHVHAADLVEFHEWLWPIGQRLLSWVFRRATCVIVLGSYWERFVVDRLGVAPERVIVRPNAVPLPDSPCARPAPGPCNIAFLGYVGKRKGVPELLAALADPRLRPLTWQAVIAGNGEVERYRARAKELGLDGRVVFTDWLPEPAARELLRHSEILVLPSHNEGLPMAILEAMAHRVAVVSTPVGSIADAVQHERTGLIVPVGDPGAVAAALERLIRDGALRLRLQNAAFDHIVKHHSIARYAAEMRAIYERLAGDASPGGRHAVTLPDAAE